MTRTGAPRFLVMGSGRSGSGYISGVLRRAGVNCGHEEYWGLHKRKYGLDGDSSWLGTFDRGFSGVRFAQFRNPHSSVASIYSSEFEGANEYQPYLMVRLQNVLLTGDREVDSIRIWLTFNRQAWAKSEFWWRVEDLDSGVLQEIGRRTGLEVSRAAEAITEMPKDFNSRPRKQFEWPDCKESEDAVALGKKMGYDL